MIIEETLAPNIEDKVEKVVETPEPSLREQLETASREVGDRARDEAGRFAAKPKDEGVTADPAAKLGAEPAKPAEQGAKPAAESQAAPETPERPTLAPNAWSHQAKAAFANADPLIKAEIAKREADIHREFTRQDAERNMGKAVSQAVAPYAQLIQAEGGNPVKAFQGYLETTRILRQGDAQTKARLVSQMCQTFGIDLAAVSGGEATDTQVAPDVKMLQNQIADLQAQVGRFGNYAENQALAPLQAQIEAFGKDPANAHFEAVKPAMAALLQAGQAQSLQDAYDMAVWARPDIRSSLLAQRTAADEAKRVADARAKADAARRAGGSITGSPGLGASADPKAGQRTLRQELEAQLSSARI